MINEKLFVSQDKAYILLYHDSSTFFLILAKKRQIEKHISSFIDSSQQWKRWRSMVFKNILSFT